MRIIFSFLFISICNLCSYAQTMSFQVKTHQGRSAISPYIYGFNFDDLLPNYGAPEKYRSFRLGGNRLTAYNWENNASNGGSDIFDHPNDDYLCGMLSVSDCTMPGNVFLKFHQQNKANGIYTLVTLPLAGYVAADKNGNIKPTAYAPSARFKQIKHIKGSAFSLTPDLSDGFVYSDEFVNYLVTKLGTATNGGIQGYSLDNEPGLWNSTHNEVHGTATKAVELLNGSVALSKAIKSIDQSAEVFGGVFYGFNDYYNLQAASDWSSVKGSYNWYIDYFLDNFKKQGVLANMRLLDVLDIHWYPEAMGEHRICDNGADSTSDQEARMQAPRTLWDPNYVENSWIANEPLFRPYLPIIPRIKLSINTYYPGTKLGISEYNYGGGADITGGIAQADVLGIFGALGVYSAHMWPLYNSSNTYFMSAFRLYNNYDGNGSHFGSTHVYAHTADSVKTSIYAAVSGLTDDTLHLIVINKTNGVISGSFALDATYNNAAVWQFKNNTPIILNASKFVVNSTSFTYSIPALSVNLIEMTKVKPLPLRSLELNLAERNGLNILTWKTIDESELASFEVQKSTDGVNFETIATVPAHNTLGEFDYQYTDMIWQTNLSNLYYRLKVNEGSGKFWYSRVVNTHLTQNKPVLFPNPVQDQLIIRNINSSYFNYSILDLAGRHIKQGRINGASNIEVSDLLKGWYTIRIEMKNGNICYLPFIKD